MSKAKRTLSAADILPRETYLPIRAEERRRVSALKRNRRVEVGPFACFYFESWETIRYQIQEMLYIENGGDAQLADEFEAYRPLLPQGDELVATVMFEIDDETRRKVALSRIGGIETHAFIRIGSDEVRGIPDPDRENTSPEGKASSVQFFHFPLGRDLAVRFAERGAQVLVGFDHPNYGHIAVMAEPVRAALTEDL